ncbi:hypothetical protein OCU04_002460 [Sclerotinia nivalis]|uniref:SET domain-containing protein n=1 Tax=Sclerotinia nivalis TaxID=352851 RepID=A0A9X0DML2_9HELO|nr:hypothetical protein OCU04_002460 [Sclerotinia nivalis]
MFTGTYQPDLQVHPKYDGTRSCSLKNNSPAGTVVHRDTILMAMWLSHEPPNPAEFMIFPPESAFSSCFETLDSQSKHQFSLLGDKSAITTYEIFLRNAIRFPAIVGCGIFIPAHGIPFEHCCTPNTICVAEPGTNKIEFRLTKPVARNEIITLCYCPASVPKADRDWYLQSYCGIKNHSCPTCQPGNYQQSDSRRKLFFDTQNILTLQVPFTTGEEQNILQEVYRLYQIASEQSLEPYLWEFLCQAEFLARMAGLNCRRNIIDILLDVMIIQAGSDHPAYIKAHRFRLDTIGLCGRLG